MLGHVVLLNQRLPHDEPARLHPFTLAILVGPCSYRPRIEWSVAHELAEHYTPSRVDPAWHEGFCDRMAAALLMPREAFAPSALSCNLRLPALSRLWSHCSMQALVTRVSDLFPGTQASAWHNGRNRFRRAHDGRRLPAEAEALEEFVAAEATYSRRESYVRERGMAARAWPTGEGRALALCVAA